MVERSTNDGDADEEGRWPHEPDEPDPEARWGNPEQELPTIPEVDVPDGSDAEPAVSRAFWAAVVMANVALLLVSLGPMLAVFRGQWRLGGALFVVGVVVFYRLYRHYRSFVADDDGADGESMEVDRGNPDDVGGCADGDAVGTDGDGESQRQASTDTAEDNG